jgi:CPA2 family monovalent cation:H+ antiporter-2
VLRVTRDARDARYSLLRGYFHGADDDTPDEREQARLLSVTLPLASPHLGEKLSGLALETLGVAVVSVRRANGAVLHTTDELTLGGGDTLVLSGQPEALALAEQRLLNA